MFKVSVIEETYQELCDAVAELHSKLNEAGQTMGTVEVMKGASMGPTAFAEIPPPAPIASVPAQTEALPPPPPEQVAASTDSLDTAGLPWDARIHTSTKSTNADGTWRKRRGVSKEAYNTVMAELGAQAATPAAAQTALPAVDMGPATPFPLAETKDYAALLELVAVKGVDFATVNGVCRNYGMSGMVDLKTNPEFQPLVYDAIAQLSE